MQHIVLWEINFSLTYSEDFSYVQTEHERLKRVADYIVLANYKGLGFQLCKPLLHYTTDSVPSHV